MAGGLKSFNFCFVEGFNSPTVLHQAMAFGVQDLIAELKEDRFDIVCFFCKDFFGWLVGWVLFHRER